MDNEQLELLKEELVLIQISRTTRVNAEVVATRILDSITDLAQDIAEKILMEQCSTYDHDFYVERG